MLPRNAREREVVALSATLKPLSKSDFDWASKNYTTDKKDNKFRNYAVILQRVKDYQVIRYFMNYGKVFMAEEVQQIWLKDGKQYFFNFNRACLGNNWLDAWSHHGQLIFRGEVKGDYTSLLPAYSCRIKSLLPHLKYANFNGHDLTKFFIAPTFRFLSTPHNLTIYEYDKKLADIMMRDTQLNYEEIFKTIKICIRNNYHASDWILYIDYWKMANQLGYDTRNIYYACPTDLRMLHNRMVRKIEGQRLQKQYEDAMKHNDEFIDKHSYLFGIEFNNGHFYFNSLDTIKDYMDEGIHMCHCVFKCRYYNKHDSLILHVQDGEGNSVATCEINVATRTIVQIQTIGNDEMWKDSSEYNEIYNFLKCRLHLFPKPQSKQKNNNATILRQAI